MKRFLIPLFFLTSSVLMAADEEICDEQSCGYFRPTAEIYYPQSFHNVTGISAFCDSVTIDDGSVWSVNSWNIDDLRYLDLNEPITITQNRQWFSWYKYRIENKNRDVSIAVNLQLGPLVDSPYMHQITNIDSYREIVYLEDGSRWWVSPGSSDEFENWLIGDYIIIGSNSGWGSSYPYILINSNMDDFVKAKQN